MISNKEWLDSLLAIGERKKELINAGNAGTEDPTGWTGRLMANLWPFDGSNPDYSVCLCLTGDLEGAYAVADLISRHLLNYGGPITTYVPLSGSSLSEDASRAADARERLELLFAEVYKDEQHGMLLQLEEWKNCAFPSAAAEILALNIRECKAYGYPICVICIAENEKELPAILRREMRVCRLAEPADTQRETFLQQKLRLTELPAEVIRALAEKTAGCSYQQLADISFAVELYCSGSKEIGAEELYAFAESQCAPEDEAQLKKRFYSGAISFFSDPHLISSEKNETQVGNDLPSSTIVYNGKTKLSQEEVDSQRSYYENMVGDELIVSLLGENWEKIKEERMAINN